MRASRFALVGWLAVVLGPVGACRGTAPSAPADPGPAVAAPAPEPALLPILRRVAYPDCGAMREVAAAAESPAEWRELAAQLQLPAGAPCVDVDFARERLVVWACPRGHLWPGFAVDVATEEGVDVLTLTVRGPSGEDPGLRAPCLVLAVPRRPHALTLVGRVAVGPAPAQERVLALLPAAH